MLRKIMSFLFGDQEEDAKDDVDHDYNTWILRRKKKTDKVFKGMTLDELEKEGFISKTDKQGISKLCTVEGVNTLVIGERKSGKSMTARAVANEIPGTYIEVLTEDQIINPYRNMPTRDAVVVVDTIQEDNVPYFPDTKNVIIIYRGTSVDEALSFIEENYGAKRANRLSVFIETAVCPKDGMPYVKRYGPIAR